MWKPRAAGWSGRDAGKTGVCALLVLALAFLVAGCFGSGLQSTIQPTTDSARIIQSVYATVTWICAGIFLVVLGLLGWALIRYRAKPGDDTIPKQTHGNLALELAWTIIPAIILIFIAIPSWEGIFRAATPPPGKRLEVNVYGRQWWWELEYPKYNVKTANELVAPVGLPLVLTVSSKDVIHSFWAPALGGKIDALPGKKNILWFTPEQEGLYYGQCAEFCGTSHANMRLRVRIVSAEAFALWTEQQKLPPAPLTADAVAGEQLFISKTCLACHTIQGNPTAVGVLGPDLTNLGARTSLASALLENTPQELLRWIKNPQKIKPGALMGVAYQDSYGETRYKPIEMTDEEARQLASYLLSPPAEAGTAARLRPQAPPAAPAPAPASPPAAAAAGTASQAVQGPPAAVGSAIQKGICWTCHIIPGVENAKGTIGPNLAGLASRPQIAEVLPLDKANLLKWLENPQRIKPGTAMPPAVTLSAAEKELVVDYLLTLK